MPSCVFSAHAASLDSDAVGICPLNVGDTWFKPFEGGRMEDLLADDHPGLNRYSPPQGLPALIDAIVEKMRGRNDVACERENVLVCAGATGALCSAVGMLAAPGDEVLIAAPFWPLIRGIVASFRAKPVEVPFYDQVDSPETAVEAFRERLSARTVALYVSTPSNPTGRVLPESWLIALAEFARRENLWLLGDEVYEDYVYRGKHVSVARFAPERTLTAYSFSKAYGMAGNRTGYLVAPPDAIAQASKISTHTFYSAPTPGQVAGLNALRDGRRWVEHARSCYLEAGEAVAAALELPAPEGSTFLFVDARAALDERGIQGFLADCFADGVALTPGSSCGAAYEGWLRLCYTAAPPAEVRAAVSKLAVHLSKSGSSRAASPG